MKEESSFTYSDYLDEVQVDPMQEMIKQMRGAAASFMKRKEDEIKRDGK